MKSGLGIVIAVCATLAALVIVVRMTSHDRTSADEQDTRRADRRGFADNGQAGALRTGGSGDSRGPSGSGSAGGGRGTGGGSGAANGSGALARRHLPDAIAGAQGSVGRDGERGSGARRADGTVDGAPFDAPLAHREVPKDVPGSGAASAPVAAEDVPDDPIPDTVFDGSGRSFDSTTRQQVTQTADLSPSGGTIAFWTKPEWDTGNLDHANFLQLGDSGLRLVKDGNFLRFEYTNATGDNELGGVADISSWQSGQWRYITATWQNSQLSLYIDGQQQFLNTPPNAPPFDQSMKIYIGSLESTNGGPVAPAQIVDPVVTRSPWTVDEVQQHLESSAPARQ
jgi:hypothetical protein